MKDKEQKPFTAPTVKVRTNDFYVAHSGVTIAEHILGSGDTVKINNLNKVLSKYELRVQDYI